MPEVSSRSRLSLFLFQPRRTRAAQRGLGSTRVLACSRSRLRDREPLKNIATSLSLRGMSALASKPVADAVDVQCTDNELIVTLVDGRRVSAPLAWFPRLLRATPKQRANWRLIGRGVGIHWDDVDEDISVRSLLAS